MDLQTIINHTTIPLAKGKFGGGSCGGRNTWETNSELPKQYSISGDINGTLDKSSS